MNGINKNVHIAPLTDLLRCIKNNARVGLDPEGEELSQVRLPRTRLKQATRSTSSMAFPLFTKFHNMSERIRLPILPITEAILTQLSKFELCSQDIYIYIYVLT